MKLITTTDKVLKETTVKATTDNGDVLYVETWKGMGVRVAVELATQVGKAARDYEQKLLKASGTNATETRLLAGRV